MYSRDYGEHTLRFEASGGLIENALVMQDKETDSYWSLMKGKAIAGRLKDTQLKELPVGVKIYWGDWLRLHPDTLILSIDGREDFPRNAYADYFDSSQGFRGSRAKDDRLATKEPIFAFRMDGRSYAAPFAALEGGRTFRIGKKDVFLFRSADSPIHRSTVAYSSSPGSFKRRAGGWRHIPSGSRFEKRASDFVGSSTHEIQPMTGYDTYWYTWSPVNPDTVILGVESD